MNAGSVVPFAATVEATFRGPVVSIGLAFAKAFL